jgi:KipI family sensor histidine kinase inhibitor
MHSRIHRHAGLKLFWKKVFMSSPCDCGQFITAAPGVLVVQFGDCISEHVNRTIRSFCATLQDCVSAGCIEGIYEWVPAYCSVSVYYDPFCISTESLSGALRECVEKSVHSGAGYGRVQEIPVCYEGDYAPDMDSVTAYTGLSREEIIALHSGQEYLVYMLGFLPGFVYLGGLDERLHMPRLDVPRTKIPAGSVAIGGAQTGIYPVESPGGWRIIGKTFLKMYDPSRSPPVLCKAGDRIRFVPVTAATFDKMLRQTESENRSELCSAASGEKSVAVISGVSVCSGGMLTTVQDAGRSGYQKDGFCISGAADRISYDTANCIAGNPPGTAVLETTMYGPELKFVLAADFCITGADQQPELDGVPVPRYTRVHAAENSVLKLGSAMSGMHSYISFTGGILVPLVLGSRSTSLKYGLGGYCGRKLLPGDSFGIGENDERWQHIPRAVQQQPSAELFPHLMTAKNNTGVLVLRVVRGAQYSFFSESGITTFMNEVYTVSAESDRMGLRLAGPKIESLRGTDIISDGIVSGSIQIPASGIPIIMMADHQTVGGYAKIGTVISADIPALAQRVPGTKIRFVFVSVEEAFVASRTLEMELLMLQEQIIDGGLY